MPTSLLDLIDLRSFSSLWYWVAVLGLWMRAIHMPLGVPVDLVRVAARDGGTAMADLEAMAEALIRRRLDMAARGGMLIVAAWAFALTALFGLGVIYGSELAQGVLLLAIPGAATHWLSLRAATRIAQASPGGVDLCNRLLRLKLTVQVIGLAAIFLTAIWGMYVNLSRYAL